MFFQNRAIRAVLRGGYRAYARSCIFSEGPRTFINSIPKSGTHLLTSALDVTPGIRNSGVHVLTWQVNRGARSPRDNQSFLLDEAAFSRILTAVNRGQYLSAHLPWQSQILEGLSATGYQALFVIRDPRDIVVSELHYIKGLKRHYLHRFFVNALHTDHDRLHALLEGVRGSGEWVGSHINPAAERYRRFLGWMTCAPVHTLRFEELIGARGGGDIAAQCASLKALYQHIGLEVSEDGIFRVAKKLSHKNSFTLRKGVIGGWRTASPSWVDAIDSELADVAAEFGY